MTIGDFLAHAAQHLNNNGIETARLDTLILLEDELGLSRAHLLVHTERQLPPSKIIKLNKKIMQRSKHLPLAYIRGKTAFYGREFTIDKHVLVPRPESESMIDLLKKINPPAHPLIADIGTGSGCLGLTAGLEISGGATVELYDVDLRTLRVAKSNARKLGVTATFQKADLLSGLKNKAYDVILANLPYVPEDYSINRAAAFEPARALFAGPDGMYAYRRFWAQARALTHKPRHIITEAFPTQHAVNNQLAKTARYYQAKTDGFAQLYTLIR